MDSYYNVYATVDAEIKEQAEKILSDLGISVSEAITLLYKQIIIHNGLPFEVDLSEKGSACLNETTKE